MPISNKFSSYRGGEVLELSRSSSSSSEGVESSFEDGGCYDGGYKRRVPSVVPEEQSCEVTEGFMAASFAKGARTSPSRVDGESP